MPLGTTRRRIGHAGGVSPEDVADHLYGLPPEEFTAARTAAAQADKWADKAAAKAIRALRKPTVSAWLVNTLVRAEPELLDQLLALGPALAEAQSGGEGDALRTLGEQRRQLVSAVTQRAFEAAGRAPTAATTAEVAATLEAALADPAAAGAVRSGRLTSALSYAGFGTVDLAGAVAAPTGSGTTRSGTTDVEEAERQALDAAGALDDAVRAAAAVAAQAEQQQAELAAATEGQRQAEQALRDARERRSAAEDAARAARHRADAARHEVERAQAAAEKARARLDRLRRRG
jgi:hypothetical protein